MVLGWTLVIPEDLFRMTFDLCLLLWKSGFFLPFPGWNSDSNVETNSLTAQTKEQHGGEESKWKPVLLWEAFPSTLAAADCFNKQLYKHLLPRNFFIFVLNFLVLTLWGWKRRTYHVCPQGAQKARTVSPCLLFENTNFFWAPPPPLKEVFLHQEPAGLDRPPG